MYLICLALGQLSVLNVWIMVSNLLNPALQAGIKWNLTIRLVLSWQKSTNNSF